MPGPAQGRCTGARLPAGGRRPRLPSCAPSEMTPALPIESLCSILPAGSMAWQGAGRAGSAMGCRWCDGLRAGTRPACRGGPRPQHRSRPPCSIMEQGLKAAVRVVGEPGSRLRGGRLTGGGRRARQAAAQANLSAAGPPRPLRAMCSCPDRPTPGPQQPSAPLTSLDGIFSSSNIRKGSRLRRPAVPTVRQMRTPAGGGRRGARRRQDGRHVPSSCCTRPSRSSTCGRHHSRRHSRHSSSSGGGPPTCSLHHLLPLDCRLDRAQRLGGRAAHAGCACCRGGEAGGGGGGRPSCASTRVRARSAAGRRRARRARVT